MRWQKKIRIDKDGVSIAADINAAVAVNQRQTGATNRVDSVSHVRVVQDARAASDSRAAGDPKFEQEER